MSTHRACASQDSRAGRFGTVQSRWNRSAAPAVPGDMRILFPSLRGAGHFGPVEPFASGFARRGHDILVAIHAAGAEMVRDHGLAVTPLDSPPDDIRNAVFAHAAELGVEESARLVAREVFATADPL